MIRHGDKRERTINCFDKFHINLIKINYNPGFVHCGHETGIRRPFEEEEEKKDQLFPCPEAEGEKLFQRTAEIGVYLKAIFRAFGLMLELYNKLVINDGNHLIGL